MIKIYFCHGWAFDKSFLQPLSDYFSMKYDVYNIDLGFFNNPSDIYINNQEYNIWIGHSYGFIYGLENFFKSINKLIAINPIRPDLYYKQIRAMIYNLRKNPTKTLDEFYNLCEINPYLINGICRESLLKALKTMLNFDERLLKGYNYMHFLHGKNDFFYSYNELLYDNISHKTISGGHLLPSTHFEEVKNFIERCLIDLQSNLLHNESNSY